MTWVGLGLIRYVAGRRHLAGRKHAADFALANGIQARTVKLYDDVSKPAHFGVNGAVAVGLAVIAPAPWLRRTTHPVHQGATRYPR